MDRDGEGGFLMPSSFEKKPRAGEEGKEFLVEAIIGKRIMGVSISFFFISKQKLSSPFDFPSQGNVQYLLKWEGCTNNENSWETAADLNCPELIQDFETRAQRPALWKNNPRRKRKSAEAPSDIPEKEGEKGEKGEKGDKGEVIPLFFFCET